jgi:hypothetical protein
MFLLVALLATVHIKADCVMDAEGRSICPDDADEATLLQAKVKVAMRTDVEKEVQLFADADPATTKIIAGVPVYNYHMAHAGGMNPSLLELSQTKPWNIFFDKKMSDADLKKFCDDAPGGAKCKSMGHPSEGGIAFVELDGTEEQLKEALKKHPEVKKDFVEPDLEIKLGDPKEKHEFIKDDGALLEEQQSSPPWGLDRIDAATGKDSSYTTESGREGDGAHVYIADTGIRTTHQDFEGRAIPYIDCLSGSCRACNGDSSCAYDRQGHGTHCAGTVGGKKYGVAKSTKLYAVKS